METSGVLIKLTAAALDVLFKTTHADIRIHGKENIPGQPVVFVINHFTRMETFFLPYIIHKTTGRDVLAMAAKELFVGGFGTFLGKLGAVSTGDKNRDRIIIGSLLKGDMPCMVFPEGQMIKDKKLMERGKFMIYNMGIRRPPHTGSAILALRSQFYREKLRYFRENGYTYGIDEYRRHFDITPETGLEDLLNQETFIVPVNLTYFPVRARKNLLNRMANLFAGDIPERLEEELEVEGTMLLDGVDIDINFGAPLPVREYLDCPAVRKIIRTNDLCLGGAEVMEKLHFRKQGIDLMMRYMDSIYAMTTVNHDHIFSYILSRYRRRKIREADFKNRAYLAIDGIRDVGVASHHSTLKLQQGYLLTDDAHGRYDSFLEAAVSDGLITLRGGTIIKNRERFTSPYDFHTIRKDNIIEVLKNEIEPLAGLVKRLDRLMMIPSFMIRREVRRRFLERDLLIFEGDYKKYFIAGETKPEHVGRPFFLKRLFQRRGVLLVHGYMAAPEEMRQLADYLFRKGYAVYGARMRGHGTSPEDLASRRWEEWYESVNRGYVVLKNSVARMAVLGFSTGAGMALMQAINKGARFRCAVSINAPLRLQNIGARFAPAVGLWNKILDKMHIEKGRMEFVPNHPDNPDINYLRNPVSGVRELEKAMRVVEEGLINLTIPVIVMQGSHDPVVNPVSGRDIFEKAGSKLKELFMVNAEKHGIIRGEGSEGVFREVKRFLDDRL